MGGEIRPYLYQSANEQYQMKHKVSYVGLGFEFHNFRIRT